MATLLTSREVAALLSVSVRSLERWRVSGKVDLPYVKLGNSVRYKPESIERCIASRTVRSTSEKGNGNA
jgi:predicted site-specific integrase-resolvase